MEKISLLMRFGHKVENETGSFVDALSALPIHVDFSTTLKAFYSISSIAEQSGLTIYDAAYLELALREKIPLVTLDAQLIEAAKNFKVNVNPKQLLTR